jgi:dihydrodipicolinate synthase/N-acetylneuraminate lyase
MKMLVALKAGDYETAETIRQTFEPLENLRNAINPIRVLHTALTEAGIANTGPILPLLHEVAENERGDIAAAAKELLAHN